MSSIVLETPYLSYSILSSSPVVLAKIVVSSTATLLALALLIYYFRSVSSVGCPSFLGCLCPPKPDQSSRMDPQRRSYAKWTDIATSFCVISHVLWPVFLFLQSSGVISSYYACSVWTRTEYFVIGAARTSFYAILALRTRSGFLNTRLDWSFNAFVISLAVCVLGMQGQTYWSMVIQPTVLLPIPEMNITTCLVVWDFSLVVVYGLSDVIFTAWLMLTFAKRLSVMTFRQDSSSYKHPDPDMVSFLRRWMLLGWLSIFGTWFFQCFGLFLSLMEISASMDSLLNLICVISVFRKADSLYNGLCGRVENACAVVGFLGWEHHIQLQTGKKGVDVSVNSGSTTKDGTATSTEPTESSHTPEPQPQAASKTRALLDSPQHLHKRKADAPRDITVVV